MITATVEAILAQRLVRRVCSECREEADINEDLMTESGLDPKEVEGKTYYRGAGCDRCNSTGYKGRVGLFELMILNDDLREMIMQNCSTDELRNRAREFGMVTLRQAGFKYAEEGVTTFDEVVRLSLIHI